MSALSYFLEREGLVTTGISLVRENTASMQPPRSLWVSFPLGRPLGIPGDIDFQHQVISSALDLLNRSSGPVLEDFPKDIPAIESDAVMACPVAFPKKAEGEVNSWLNRLNTEMQLIKPWYELSVRRRGRSLVGISDFSPIENVTKLSELIESGDLASDVTWLKRAVEDLKAYYLEAMTAKPGTYDKAEQFNQFWADTEMGAAILAIADRYQNSDNDGLKLVARLLAPREAVGAATGPKTFSSAPEVGHD